MMLLLLLASAGCCPSGLDSAVDFGKLHPGPPRGRARAAAPSTLQFHQLTLGGLSAAAISRPPHGFVASRWPAPASAALPALEFGLGRLSSGAYVEFETVHARGS
jgi:hypothetical protein